ncbi:MAG TPA: hypothetical protein VGF29_02425 [Hyphomicrobiaceae bacterium]|jgi:hypothetical protein
MGFIRWSGLVSSPNNIEAEANAARDADFRVKRGGKFRQLSLLGNADHTDKVQDVVKIGLACRWIDPHGHQLHSQQIFRRWNEDTQAG